MVELAWWLVVWLECMKHIGVLKKCSPTSPGLRHKVYLDGVVAGSQVVPKELVGGGRRSGGRNHLGQITCRHRGGGNKPLYREVTSLKINEMGLVRGIQWDPNRESPIALLEVTAGRPSQLLGLKSRGSITQLSSQHGSDGSFGSVGSLAGVNEFATRGCEYRYVLAGESMSVGDVVSCFLEGVELGPNQRTLMTNRPVGTTVYDVSMGSGLKSQWVKTPGTRATVLRQEMDGTRVRMPSGELRWLPHGSFGTIGSVAGKDHMLEVRGKAGIRRRKGIRPTVRGCAMNPIDHPHGGRTKGGRHDVTPWAKVAKGQPTRPKKKPLGLIVKTSRQVRLGATNA